MQLKQKLIIHIGTDKTGTTSLQNFFFNNYKQLLENNIYYPIFETQDKNNPDHCFKKSHHGEFFGLKSNYKRPISQLVNEIINKKLDLNIISHESLWKYSESNLKEMSDLFSRFDLIVVMFVRHQAALLQGMYSQRLKRIVEQGIFKNKNSTFRPVINGYNFKAKFLDYKFVYKTWKKFFPNCTFIILPFYEAQKNNLNIVDLFLNYLQIEKSNRYKFQNNRNLSLGYSSVIVFEFWRYLNEYLKIEIKDKQIDKVKELIKDLPHTINDKHKWFFTKEEVKKISKKFEISNKFIDEKFFPHEKWLSLEERYIISNICENKKEINIEYLRDVFDYIIYKIEKKEN